MRGDLGLEGNGNHPLLGFWHPRRRLDLMRREEHEIELRRRRVRFRQLTSRPRFRNLWLENDRWRRRPKLKIRHLRRAERFMKRTRG